MGKILKAPNGLFPTSRKTAIHYESEWLLEGYHFKARGSYEALQNVPKLGISKMNPILKITGGRGGKMALPVKPNNLG